MGVGWQVRRCRGKSALASGLKTEVTINMVLGGASVALSKCEGGVGCGSEGAALLGRECIGVRLKKGSDNQHGVGGGVGGLWLCQGVRAVAGVGLRAWRCRGRSALASGLKREVTIAMLLGGLCVMRVAVAMSLHGGRVVDDATRGGGRTM